MSIALKMPTIANPGNLRTNRIETRESVDENVIRDILPILLVVVIILIHNVGLHHLDGPFNASGNVITIDPTHSSSTRLQVNSMLSDLA